MQRASRPARHSRCRTKAAAIGGAAKRGLGATQVALLAEQATEVASPVEVAGVIRLPPRRFGRGKILAMVLQQRRQLQASADVALSLIHI